MLADRLLQRLDQLDHRERLAALIAHGRGQRPAEREDLARALFAGDPVQRRLALALAQMTPESPLAWEALSDPSRLVRGLAATLVGRGAAAIPVAPDAMVTRLLDEVDAETLAVIRRQLVRRGHATIAEALVEGLIARDRLAEAGALLSVCRVEAITGWLATVAWTDEIWPRLATYQTDVMIDRVARLFAAAEQPSLVWDRFGVDVWAAIAKRSPATLAAWIDRWADADALPASVSLALRHLVRWSPTWMVGALASRVASVVKLGLPAGLASRVRDVADAALAPLAAGLAREAPHLLAQLLARCPYPQRGRLFELAIAPLETSLREWPPGLLAVLPTPVRDREAARMLDLARAQRDASWRRTLLGLRDIEHARPALEREGQAAQASDRAEALAELVRSSHRARAGMAETLTSLRRIRNEQDPVRCAVLTALAEAPAARFTDAALLDQVVAPIFEARDTSYATRAQATRLAHRLMIAHAAAPRAPMFQLGLSILERLAGRDGALAFADLSANLPRGAEVAIVDALLPWVAAASKRLQEAHVMGLWRSLGKRAWRAPALAALLEQQLWNGSKSSAAASAGLWLQDPRSRDERVRALVARDRSALYLPAVFEHCHRRRQALLTERLAATAPSGRFYDDKVVLIPWVAGGFQRWPLPLQRQYVELLRRAEREPKRFSSTRAALIAQRARVPVTRAQDLSEELTAPEIPVQEAALSALAWLDEPAAALPILLEHLDGDRARVAMYALPRLARLVPRAAFVEHLAGLLARPRLKVTVHKEALRLLGQLATPRAVALLAQAWAAPLHRDVRIAALHAARALLGQERAWELLAAAARDPEAELARAVVEVRLHSVAEAHRPRYLAVMSTVADHPDATARAALFDALIGGWWTAAPRAAAELAAEVVRRMDVADPWQPAVQVVAAGARALTAHPAIQRAVSELVATADREVAPAGEHDRLAHQRLLALLAALTALPAQRVPAVAALFEALAAPLLGLPAWWEEGARLRLAAAANPRVADVCAELLRHAPTPRMRNTVEELAAAAAGLAERDWSAEDAERAVASLRAAGAGRAAVQMLASFGPRWGWGPVWQAALGELRQAEDLEVRLAARRVWICPPE